jgi:uncharacterized protein (TIGR03382 family)
MFAPRITRTLLVAAVAASGLVSADAAAREFFGAPLNFSFSAFDGTGFSPTPVVGQLNSTTWQVGGLSTGDVTYRATATSGDAARGLASGAVTTGGIYAFQVTGGARILGFQPTDNVLTPGAITLRLINSTGGEVTSASVSYDIWFRNDSPRSSSVKLQWSNDGINWTTVDAATSVSPAAADPAPGWTFRRVAVALSGLSWPADQPLRVRWFHEDAGGSGAWDEIGIDAVEFRVTECGDGIVHPGEECERAVDGSARCDVDCTWAECGDGVTNGAAGEECDDPGSAECDDDCSLAYCGDGTANMAADEPCDAGSTPAVTTFPGATNDLNVSVTSLMRAQVVQLNASARIAGVELEMANGSSGACEGGTVLIYTVFPGTSDPNQGNVRATSTGYSTGTSTNGWVRVWAPVDVTLPAGKYAVAFDPTGVQGSCIWRGSQSNPYTSGKAWTGTALDPLELGEHFPSGHDLHVALHTRVMSETCNDDCTLAVCGDEVTNPEAGEDCDEGGNTATCDGDCTFPECGDGYPNPAASEQCDDAGDSATCDANCTPARCGDLYVNEAAGESCEDGNTAVGDGCDDACVTEECGNGRTQVGEDCDGGGVDTETCNVDCTFASCGDGYTNEAVGEECDSGGESVICNANCTLSECGDGIRNATAGEACDPGRSNSPTCDTDCTPAECGDEFVNVAAGEQCDDGNTVDGDGCSAQCLSESCGDGVIQRPAGEQCDDGNVRGGDGCDENCFIETCGNNIVQRDEDCDEGGPTATCDADCTFPECGDGSHNVLAGEQCDDGNNVDGDGCTAECVREFCGDGVVQEEIGEECDDGNNEGGDGCRADCKLPSTGDVGDVGMDVGPDVTTDTGTEPRSRGSKGGCTASAQSGVPSMALIMLVLGAALARRRRG